MARKVSELQVLDEDRYGYNFLQYPSEGIGQKEEVPPYVIFYINVPKSSKYEVTKQSGVTSTSTVNAQLSRGRTSLFNAETSALTAAGIIAGGSDLVSAVGSGVTGDFSGAAQSATRGVLKSATIGGVGVFASKVELKPRYDRIVEAIKLYMPDTVIHTDSHDYDQISVTDAMGQLRTAQVGGELLQQAGVTMTNFSGVESAISAMTASPSGAEAAGRLAEYLGVTDRGFTNLLVKSQGFAINPQLEMLYMKTNFRSFLYEFRFQPRSKKETEEVKKIITTFRRYAAPELAQGQNGLYYIPPAEFDIEYRFMGAQNQYINKISSCVLESIDVNYSSAGQFAVFEETGAPVQIAVTLRFREVDVITREMVDQGF